MKREIVFLMLAGITGVSFGQGKISIQVNNLSKVVNEENGVALFNPEAKVKLIVYDQEILRVKISRDKSAFDLTDVMMKRPGGKLTKIAESTKEIFYSTGKINVSVSKIPLRQNFMDAFNKALNQNHDAPGLSPADHARTNYRKLFSDEQEFRIPESLTDRTPADNKLQIYDILVTAPGNTITGFHLDRINPINGDSLPNMIRNDVGFTGKSQLPSSWNLGYQQPRVSLKIESRQPRP